MVMLVYQRVNMVKQHDWNQQHSATRFDWFDQFSSQVPGMNTTVFLVSSHVCLTTGNDYNTHNLANIPNSNQMVKLAKLGEVSCTHSCGHLCIYIFLIVLPKIAISHCHVLIQMGRIGTCPCSQLMIWGSSIFRRIPVVYPGIKSSFLIRCNHHPLLILLQVFGRFF